MVRVRGPNWRSTWLCSFTTVWKGLSRCICSDIDVILISTSCTHEHGISRQAAVVWHPLVSTPKDTKGLAVWSAALAADAAAGEHMTSVHTWSSGIKQKDMSCIKQAFHYHTCCLHAPACMATKQARSQSAEQGDQQHHPLQSADLGGRRGPKDLLGLQPPHLPQATPPFDFQLAQGGACTVCCCTSASPH